MKAGVGSNYLSYLNQQWYAHIPSKAPLISKGSFPPKIDYFFPREVLGHEIKWFFSFYIEGETKYIFYFILCTLISSTVCLYSTIAV